MKLSVSVYLEGSVETLGYDLIAVTRMACRSLSDIALELSFDTDSRSRLFPC
jgi:hypothetical protein